jgi:hypothetical protein
MIRTIEEGYQDIYNKMTVEFGIDDECHWRIMEEGKTWAERCLIMYAHLRGGA